MRKAIRCRLIWAAATFRKLRRLCSNAIIRRTKRLTFTLPETKKSTARTIIIRAVGIRTNRRFRRGLTVRIPIIPRRIVTAFIRRLSRLSRLPDCSFIVHGSRVTKIRRRSNPCLRWRPKTNSFRRITENRLQTSKHRFQNRASRNRLFKNQIRRAPCELPPIRAVRRLPVRAVRIRHIQNRLRLRAVEVQAAAVREAVAVAAADKISRQIQS